MEKTKKTRAPLKRHAIQAEMNKVRVRGASFMSKRVLFTELETYLNGNHRDGTPRRASLAATGYLSTMIKVTILASQSSYRLKVRDFETTGGGQVRSVGGGVKKALEVWGFNRALGSEAGRTSRNTIGFMREYVDLLNKIHNRSSPIDHSMLMLFWMKKVREYFKTKPIEVAVPANRTLQSLILSIISAVRKRERETVGRTIMGTVMQHMIGAKLEIVLRKQIKHHKANHSDAQTGRAGDFEIEDCVLHVTTAPSEKLIQRCNENIDAGKSPIIVTLHDRTRGAKDLTENAGRLGEIEVLGFEEFMVSNLIEMSEFRNAKRHQSAQKIIDKYNSLIEDIEEDSGLKIMLK